MQKLSWYRKKNVSRLFTFSILDGHIIVTFIKASSKMMKVNLNIKT